MKGSQIGLIIVGFVILIILVAGGLYLYHVSRFHEFTEGHKTIETAVTNNTSVPQTIIHRGRAYISHPGETSSLKVERHDDISTSAVYPTGERIEFVHRLSNDKITHLYITPDGFRTNLTMSKNVDLVNGAEYPVLFAQKSLKGGTLYLSGEVPPQSASEKHLVGSRSIWQVLHPGSEKAPIAEIRVGSQPLTRLVFDGLRLRAY